MKTITKIQISWYYGILLGFCNIIDGITLVLTLGHYTTNLTMGMALYAAKKGWCKTETFEELMNRLAKKFKVKLILLNEESDLCKLNGVEPYRNKIYNLVNKIIYLGIFKNQEYRALLFFYELTRCRYDANQQLVLGENFNESRDKHMLRHTYELAKENGVTFSKKAKKWAKKYLKTNKNTE